MKNPFSAIATLIYLTLRQFLHVEAFRYLIAVIRYIYFAVILRRSNTFYKEEYESTAIAKSPENETTISHNLNAFKGKLFNSKGFSAFSRQRTARLLRPIFSIDRISNNSRKLKVLSIGPRTEGEILHMLAYGLKLKNITGLDLLSYSPWIQLGDMHSLPYEDNTFDVIISGWTLPYSNEKQKACDELYRVTKDNGVIGIGATYNPKKGFSESPLNSCSNIYDFFESKIKTKYFSYDQEQENPLDIGGIIAIFSITKHNK